jgi:hexosaminidase
MMNIRHTFLKLIFLVILSLYACIAQAESNLSPTATFELIDNAKDEKSFNAKMTLSNVSKLKNKNQWQLAFNSIRTLTSITSDVPATLKQLKQAGDFYIIEFQVPDNKTDVTFTVHGKGVIKNITDGPVGYFLFQQSQGGKANFLPVVAKTVLPAWTPKPGEDEASRNVKKDHTPIEGNPIDTSLTPDTSLIVPLPAELTREAGAFILNEATELLYDESNLKNTAEFFTQNIFPATGLQLVTKEYHQEKPLSNTILLTHKGTEKLNNLSDIQKNEAYILEVTPAYIIIRAKTSAGFFYGLQSLRQLFPAPIFSPTLQKNMAWVAPSVSILDYPRFEYRGLHLDVARHFVPVDQVKRLIDLMAIHKLNALQWHLTDDEGWRIEIKKYPELTIKGSKRGYDPNHYSEHDLLPAFGSGYKSYGGYYTQDDIRAIVKYADERHITIVPEIDLPGHARALIMSLPDLLIDKEDPSSYTSIQGYHDNILSLCKSTTFTVINDIMSEVADLFPSKYIHIGGDEVPLGAWTESCMAKKYDPTQREKFRDKVQNDFMSQVQKIIQSKGKQMAGWEEVAGESATLTAPLRVYIWNTGKMKQAYEKSKHLGYEVIMSPAENLYFDLSYNEDPNEPGQYWAAHVDTFSPYVLMPINEEQSEDVIKGVQGQLWSEFIDSNERLDYLAFPKVAGLAELAWSPATRRNWRNFSARMSTLHIPRLQSYGVQYRKTEFQH